MQDIAQSLGVKCEYCHAGQRMGAAATPTPGTAPTRVDIARAMIAMTRDLNTKIVAATGKPANETTRVTCMTCHHGVAIPASSPTS
jgi:nitrate/TMAO reductase-like tetraheme cytochrome c subunit